MTQQQSHSPRPAATHRQPVPAEKETASNEADRSNFEANYPDGTAPSSGPRTPKGPGKL
ncbi:hypothetical protein [Chitiniphilus eburneus]|uniref:hypothetical protein n=1 Tax=Chitiniphilus eburneus TaxID=2571148 RepID=UPI0035CF5A18